MKTDLATYAHHIFGEVIGVEKPLPPSPLIKGAWEIAVEAISDNLERNADARKAAGAGYAAYYSALGILGFGSAPHWHRANDFLKFPWIETVKRVWFIS